MLDDELLDCELWQPLTNNAITQTIASRGLKINPDCEVNDPPPLFLSQEIKSELNCA